MPRCQQYQDASNIKHSLAMTKLALHSMATIYIL